MRDLRLNRLWARNRASITLLLAGFAATTTVAPPALAESEAGAETPTSSPASASAPDDDVLQEIVVSANRRRERAQDVGAALTYESGEKIEAMNITRAEDLQKLSPGLVAIPNAGSAVTSFSIRGLSQADEAEHEEQPVAVYQDGTYVAIPAATGFPIYDVDHVEVLRGPQGTLFGRNATGGLVQFFSNQPTPGFSGGVAYTGGDYQLHRLEGFLNGGNEDVSDRFAYYLSERAGYIKNLNGPNLLSEDVAAFRNQTKFRLGDSTNATLRLETWQQNGTSVNYQTPSYPNGIYDEARPSNYPTLYGYVNPSHSPFVESVDTPGEIFKRASTAALNLDHQIGDITFYSTTSYIRTTVHYLEDTDGTPFSVVTYADGGVANTYGQEFRLVEASGPLRWTTGINYFRNQGDFYVRYNSPTFCDPTDTTVCETSGFGSAHLPLTDAGKGAELATAYGIDYKALSGFGQVERDFSDRITGIVGARYTYDDQKFKYGFNCIETLANACESIYGDPAGTSGLFNLSPLEHLAQKKGLVSGKVQMNYKVDADVMLYGLFSRGVKSGGYFDATAGNVPASALSFQPETLYATEVGMKSQWFDRRLTVNADYYHYNYQNSQQFNFVLGVYFTVINLPATANGVELETSFKITPDLILNLSGAYNDIWVHNVLPCATCTPLNQRPVDAPPLVGNWGLEKLFTIGDRTVAIAYNGHFVSDRYYVLINQPVTHAPSYVVQDASVRVDVGGGMYVEGFCNNLANKTYATALFDNTGQGFILTHIAPPRMGGLKVGIKF